VVRTRVGYSGGEKVNPTYHDLGDHSETIQIDYDPLKISYEQLLDVFWASHNPTVSSFSVQYRSAIFYHNEEQRRLAVESKEQQEKERGQRIYTEIIPYSRFYLAEDYHQKYALRNVSVIAGEVLEMYSDIEDFVNSTAVARLNGYAGGYGDADELKTSLDKLGLSEAAEQRLLEIADRGLKPGCITPPK
jgi:peptide-methionine (S)-S-oxide reductase